MIEVCPAKIVTTTINTRTSATQEVTKIYQPTHPSRRPWLEQIDNGKYNIDKKNTTVTIATEIRTKVMKAMILAFIR